MILLMLACSLSSSTEPTHSAPPVTDDSTGSKDSTGNDIDWDSLTGTVPAENLPLPTFTATNSDGAERHGQDLLGKPTVMWFYPAADTAG